jgi:uncharacterized protein (TIGR00255 family)
MIHSMTAFARREAEGDWGSAVWELRSVNHRYLDVGVRLPEDLRFLEPEVRARAAARLRRGKLECTLRYQPRGTGAGALDLDMELVEQLAKASRQVDEKLFNPAAISSLDVLRWPGVVRTALPDQDAVAAAVLGLLDAALGELAEARRREGERIAEMLGQRLADMRPLVAAVREQLPGVLAGMRERLRGRLAELAAELDEARLEQELVLLASRMDVAEELDRLDAHVAEVEHILGSDEPTGRRLDFMMQELNREANTLASKSAAAETTRAAVDLKVLIEQMREQVQNVE